MICEMCGRDVPTTRPMMVEGSKLNLCPNCMKFGDDYKAPRDDTGSPATDSTVIQQRLEKRERRMQTKDIYAGAATVEIVDNYGEVIRKARMKKGMDMEEFAKSISEKKGTLVKVESQNLVPDDKLVAKLEKALNIKLKETVQSGGQVSGGAKSQTMTLGNFIKVEKK